jgi:CHAT domain-containing protein
MNTSYFKIFFPFFFATLAGCAESVYLRDNVVESNFVDNKFHTKMQITVGNESNFAPNLSANGRIVFYTSDRSGNKDIWERDLSTGEERRITRHSSDDFSPVIDPEGERIAFVSRRIDAAGDIHIIAAGSIWENPFGDGTYKTINIDQPKTIDNDPAWFPGGRSLVFASREPGADLPQLMKVDLDDLKPVKIHGAKGSQPSISPDGRYMVFVSNGDLKIYDFAEEEVSFLTKSGAILDGQPTFTTDGKFVYFTRFSDDSNDDGILNADDRPVICRVNFDLQKSIKIKENFSIEFLTSSRDASYSSQIVNSYLYVSIQQQESLDIFRLPYFGHLKRDIEQDALKQRIAAEESYESKAYLYRLGQSTSTNSGKLEAAASFAIEELRHYRRNRKNPEARWLYKKIMNNFPKFESVIRLAKIEMATMAAEPLFFPMSKISISPRMKKNLKKLGRKVEKLENSEDEVLGNAQLTRAKIQATLGNYYLSEEILNKLISNSNRQVSAAATAYQVLITPKILDMDAAIDRMVKYAKEYSLDRAGIQRTTKKLIKLIVRSEKYKLRNLQRLKTESKGEQFIAIMAHRAIAEYFSIKGEASVYANELREIVDIYPESPNQTLKVAEILLSYEERNKRSNSAEAMLKKLLITIGSQSPNYLNRINNMLTGLYLRRGESLLQQKRSSEAISTFQKVLLFDASNIEAHKGRIRGLNLRGESLITADNYRAKALETPNEAPAVFLHAFALTFTLTGEESSSARREILDDVIDILLRAELLRPNLMQIHQTLGWAYFQLSKVTQLERGSPSIYQKFISRWRIVENFFSSKIDNEAELAIRSMLKSFHLSRPNSIGRTNSIQNLAFTFYDMGNFQKALSFYVKRLAKVELNSFSSLKIEAINWRNAGRSAFQVDELELAEKMQIKSLAAWESVGDFEEIARSLDALALTFRGQNRFKKAYDLYLRIFDLAQKNGDRQNAGNAATNLGFCAYKMKMYSVALDHLRFGEKSLDLTESAEKNKSPTDSVKVSLNGEESQIDGFDKKNRKLLIETIKGKIFSDKGLTELERVTVKSKINIFTEIHENRVDSDDAEGEYKQKEISIAQNNLAFLENRSGDLVGARNRYYRSYIEAKSVRTDDQKLMSEMEWQNYINYSRLNLDLIRLKKIRGKELNKFRVELDDEIENFRKYAVDGTGLESLPLGILISIRKKILAEPEGLNGQKSTNRKNDLLSAHKLLSKTSYEKAPIWVANSLRTEGGLSEEMRNEIRNFRRNLAGGVDFKWKYFVSLGNWKQAFEKVQDDILGGAALKSLSERHAIDKIYSNLLRISNEESRSELLRKFAFVESLRVLNGLGESSDTADMRKKFVRLSGKKMSVDTKAALFYLDRENVLHLATLISGQYEYKNFKSMKKPSMLRDRVETYLADKFDGVLEGHPLYLIPINCDELIASGRYKMENSNGSLFHGISTVPALEFVPIVLDLDRVPRFNIFNVTNDRSSQLPDEIRGFEVSRFDNLEPMMNGEARYSDILHVGSTLNITNSVGTESFIGMNDRTAIDLYKSNIWMKDMGKIDLGQVSTIVFQTVLNSRNELNKRVYDGWKLVSISMFNAGVSGIVLEGPKGGSSGDADWSAFYRDFKYASLGEALKLLPPRYRIVGYPGLGKAQFDKNIDERISESLEEAEDSFDDKYFEDSRIDFLDAYYYSLRGRNNTDTDRALEGLVNSNYKLRKFGDSLFFKQIIIQRIERSIAQMGEESEYDEIDLGESILDAGVLAVRGYRHKSAKRYLDSAEAIFQQADESSQIGRIYKYRGIDAVNRSKYREAIEHYLKSHKYFQNENPSASSERLVDIAGVYRNRLSEYSKALEFYDRAINEQVKNSGKSIVRKILIDKANTQLSLGQVSSAIDSLTKKILPSISKNNNPLGWSRAQGILANAYYRAGKFEKARLILGDVKFTISKISKEKDRISIMLDVENLDAMIYGKLGHYKKALEKFEELISVAEKSGFPRKVALLYNNSGYWARESGDVEKSLLFFHKALKIDRKIKNAASISFDQRNIGLSLIMKNSLSSARNLLQESLKSSKKINLNYNKIVCYMGLAEIFIKERKWKLAGERFAAAAKISSDLNMKELSWQSMAGVGFSKWMSGELDSAENIFEKSIQILESMDSGLSEVSSKTGFFGGLGTQEVYGRYINLLMSRGKSEKAWQIANRAKRRFTNDLYLDSTMNSSDNSTEDDSLLVQLQKNLPSDSAVVEYFISEDEINIWVISANFFGGHSVQVGSGALSKTLKEFRELMNNYSTANYLAKDLSKMLIAPIYENILTARHLIVIPHKDLNLLPFAALKSKNRFLIESHSISYENSSRNLLKILKSKPRIVSSSSSILALANPSNNREKLQKLPFAEKEVQAISRYFKDIRTLSGPAATVDLLKKEIHSYDIIHIAAHGDYNRSHPLDSSIYLAQTRNDLGVLKVRDIRNVATDASLVTLSACESGVVNTKGAGITNGFNSAFIKAGASTVVSSLWRISDVSSAVVMKRFYRSLSSRVSKAESLREAQIVTMKYFKHPAFWSGFKLSGDFR